MNLSSPDNADISVIIPTHNRASTIKMAVMSVLTQTSTIREVIVVDDGSTDDTLKILGQLSDSRIRILSTGKKSGAPAARNLGVKASLGRWIAFQDSDDYWFAHKLERQLECLSQNPEAVLCSCSFIQYYGNQAKLIPGINIDPRSEAFGSDLLASSFISTQTILVKKSILEQVGGFAKHMPRLQDWELVLRIAKVGSFCFVQEPLVIAYDSPGSLTSNERKGAEARIKILDINHGDFSRHPKLYAHHLHVIGRIFWKTGGFVDARNYFWKALLKQPFRPTSLFWLFAAVTRVATASIHLKRDIEA